MDMTSPRDEVGLKRKEMIKQIGEYLGPIIVKALDDATRCCLNCDHFRPNKGETCGLNNKVPPPKIAARGCECFEDEIPF